MSLYGNVKKIGSATFQFDRKYSNRTDMDKAAAIDGVYAGRYVLVEYGYRFGIDGQDLASNEEGTAVSEFPDGYKLITTEDGSVRVEGVTENAAFKANAEIDLRNYGAVYDSTVWQKIYVDGKDKYIMVAELNAMAPKLDITQETPLTYKALETNIDQYRTAGVVTGKFNENGELLETVRLTNAKEVYNKPYFDTGIDTELTYLMHLPTSLNLEMDSNTIDFHEEGFNLVYSYPDSEGVSTIAWIPKGHDLEGKVTYLDNYKINSDNLTDNGGNKFATLQGSEYPMDTKMLFMSFPALGNAMNALYNLLYGKPDPEDDLTHGAMRPYFKRFLENIQMKNRAYVYDYSIDPQKPILKYVTYNGPENPEYIFTKGLIGEKVVATLNVNDALRIHQLESPHWLEPHELVEIRFRDDVDVPNRTNESFPYLGYYQLDSENYANSVSNKHAGAYVLWDIKNSCPITTEIHIPNGDEDPDLDWLKDVPALADILANNTAGLATILSSLFGSVDPLTGTTKYYLYNDWRTKVEEGSSTPAIVNKPKVVGGYEQTFTSVLAGAEQYDSIGRKIYETPGYFYDIGTDANTSGQQILYPHTEITTSSYYSGGDFIVDYNTWQLIDYQVPTIQINIDKDLSINNADSQFNQDAITIIKQDNIFAITSTVALKEFELDEDTGKWLLLDVDTGFMSIQGLILNGVVLSDLDEVEADSFNLPKGHLVLKVKAESMPVTYTISASGFNDLVFTITYKQLAA